MDEEKQRRLVGPFLRTLREMQGLSQLDVERLTETGPLRVSRGMVGSIERGESLPGLEVLASLASVLHFDPSEILERVSIGPPIDLTDLSGEQLDEIARSHFEAGRYREAVATWDAQLELLALDPPKDKNVLRHEQANVELRRSVALRRHGALGAARASAERAVELAADDKTHAKARISLASLLSIRGLHRFARDSADRAIELAAAVGDPEISAQAASAKAAVLSRTGETRDAYDVLRTIGDCSERQRAIVLGSLGDLLCKMGKVSHAREKIKEARTISRGQGDLGLEASWQLSLAQVELAADRKDEAKQLATSARSIGRRLRHNLTQFRAEWLLYELDRDPDRIAHLHRLYAQVRLLQGDEDVRAFERSGLANDRENS